MYRAAVILLCLAQGLPQISLSPEREYHWIRALKNWPEARDYCRSFYKDLVNIRNPEEWEEVSRYSQGGEWIGLYKDNQSTGWKWSTGEIFNYTRREPWQLQEPNSLTCVYITKNQWLDAECDIPLPFICYTELPRTTLASEPEVNMSETETRQQPVATTPQVDDPQSTEVSKPELPRTSAAMDPEIELTQPPTGWGTDLPQTTIATEDAMSTLPSKALETGLLQTTIASELQVSMQQPANILETDQPQKPVPTTLEAGTVQLTNISDTGLHLISDVSGREYHLVTEMKSWMEARDHCRRTYTDLASIPSQEEKEVLDRFAARGTWLWIGLYNEDQTPEGWKWTTGESFNYTNWAPWYMEESDTSFPICVYMDTDQWIDTHCDIPLPFICYTDPSQKLVSPGPELSTAKAANLSGTGFSQATKLPGRGYHLIKELKSWSEARDYCQSRYTDLVNIPSREEWEVVTRFAIQGVWLWIGLYNDDRSSNGWKWTTGEMFNYTSWVPWHPQELNTTFPSCVYVDSDRWMDTQCDILLPFVCYTDLPQFSIADEERALIEQLGNVVEGDETGSQSLHPPKSRPPSPEGRPLIRDREYHVIQQEKTWKEARDYCRRNYTDLVSFRNPKEEEFVGSLLSQGDWKWIGLYNEELTNNGWKWTNGDNFTYSNWALWYPDQFTTTSLICVCTDRDEWFDLQCDFTLPFVCYTELRQSKAAGILPEGKSYLPGLGEKQRWLPQQAAAPKYSEYVQSIGTGERLYILIDQRKSWSEARDYCQRHYTNLVSLRTEMESEIVGPMVTQAKWIGLYSDGFGNWRWSNEDAYQYANWSPSPLYPNRYAAGLPMCVYASSKGWAEERCDDQIPFICYLDIRSAGYRVLPENVIPPAGEHKDITLRHTISGRNFRPNRNQTITSGDRMFFLIEEEKTWNKAWSYCRNHYTNLASIRNAEEASIIAVLEHGPQWIGLYTDGLSGWMWTNGDQLSYSKWGLWHPYSFNNSLPMCVAIFDAEWHEADCDFPFPFICYRDLKSNSKPQVLPAGPPSRHETPHGSKDYSDLFTDLNGDLLQGAKQPVFAPVDFELLSEADEQSQISMLTARNPLTESNPKSYNKSYIFDKNEKTWIEAQNYCRAEHSDLVSVQSLEENALVAQLLQSDLPAWIGLYNRHQSEYSWMWANGDDFNFSNWDHFYPMDFTTMSVCVIMVNGRWKDAPCDFKFPFICSRGLVQESDGQQEVAPLKPGGGGPEAPTSSSRWQPRKDRDQGDSGP